MGGNGMMQMPGTGFESKPYGMSMPMGQGSMPMGPMGTSAGLQGTMPYQPSMGAGMTSATYGNLPMPAGAPMGPPPSMPQMMPPVGGPMMTSASIAPGPMSAPPQMPPQMPMQMPAQMPVAPAPGLQQQWVPGPVRPEMTYVANAPIVGGAPQNPIQYGPSYNMSYQPRSTADKTAVKYTGFLPMEGIFEEDTCRIG